MQGDEYIADVFDRVDEKAARWREAQKPYTSKTPYGMHQLDDEQFLVEFLKNSLADPYWAQALTLVEGGDDEWRRFERLMEPRMAGLPLGEAI